VRWRLAILVAALAAAIVPLPPQWIERAYSTSAYRALQPWLTTFSNAVPFALLDALIVLTVAASIALLVLDLRRRSRSHAGLRFLVRTVVTAAVFYLGFLLSWGLNYRRIKLADKLDIDEAAISAGQASAATAMAISELNRLHSEAHTHGWAAAGVIDRDLADGLARTVRDLGVRAAPTLARPKTTLLNLYFERAGVEGMTDPYFLETLVLRDLLPFERPFVIAHEWSHLAGFADESEANFIGWLTTLHGSAADQYSGWLFAYSELSRVLQPGDRSRLPTLAPGPRADLTAIANRYQRQVDRRVAAAGWRVYDSYLKANRIPEGNASYDEVVRFVLGVRFGPDWTPRLKNDD
jgi:hypothetical protein